MLSRTATSLARLQTTQQRLARSLHAYATTQGLSAQSFLRPRKATTISVSPIKSHLQARSSSSSSSQPPMPGMAAPTDTAAAELGPLTPESLTQTLKSKLPSISHLEIHDMSGGCGQAFTAVIVSDEFKGKTALARHRLINAALKQEIAAIHAWTPRCLTVEQWEKEKGQ